MSDTVYSKAQLDAIAAAIGARISANAAREGYCVTGSGANIDVSERQMLLTVEAEADPNYSLSSNQVTVTSGGLFLVSFSIYFDEEDNTGAARSVIDGFIKVGGSKSARSVSPGYTRELSGGGGASNTFVKTLPDGAVIDLFTDGVQTTPNLAQGATQLSLVKLGG